MPTPNHDGAPRRRFSALFLAIVSAAIGVAGLTLLGGALYEAHEAQALQEAKDRGAILHMKLVPRTNVAEAAMAKEAKAANDAGPSVE